MIACKIVLDSATRRRVSSASMSGLRDRLIRKRKAIQNVLKQRGAFLLRQMIVGSPFPAFWCLYLSPPFRSIIRHGVHLKKSIYIRANKPYFMWKHLILQITFRIKNYSYISQRRFKSDECMCIPRSSPSWVKLPENWCNSMKRLQWL